MKRVVAVIVLVTIVFNCAPTLPQYKHDLVEREDAIIISDRVGETIDAGEGERFGLFAEIGEFKGAKFFAIEDGGYVVDMATAGENLSAINRDQDAVTILRYYVNNYEEINIDRTAFESKWGILDYDTLGVPITEKEVSLVMKQSRSRAVKGGLAGCGGAVLFGLIVGFGIAAGSDGSGTDIGPALGAAAGVIVLAAVAVIGLIAGGTMIATTYARNTASFLKTIKEARKPRAVE